MIVVDFDLNAKLSDRIDRITANNDDAVNARFFKPYFNLSRSLLFNVSPFSREPAAELRPVRCANLRPMSDNPSRLPTF